MLEISKDQAEATQLWAARRAISPSTFKLKIPPGVRNGDRLQLRSPAITVVTKILPQEPFRLEGKDIFADLEIMPWDAILGATLSVPTPVGRVRLRVPPGTEAGTRLRLRGQGLPEKQGRSDGRGDMLFTVAIKLPRKLSRREVSLWEELREIRNGEKP